MNCIYTLFIPTLNNNLRKYAYTYLSFWWTTSNTSSIILKKVFWTIFYTCGTVSIFSVRISLPWICNWVVALHGWALKFTHSVIVEIATCLKKHKHKVGIEFLFSFKVNFIYLQQLVQQIIQFSPNNRSVSDPYNRQHKIDDNILLAVGQNIFPDDIVDCNLFLKIVDSFVVQDPNNLLGMKNRMLDIPVLDVKNCIHTWNSLPDLWLFRPIGLFLRNKDCNCWTCRHSQQGYLKQKWRS